MTLRIAEIMYHQSVHHKSYILKHDVFIAVALERPLLDNNAMHSDPYLTTLLMDTVHAA
jgi:hypothetical protein